MKKTLSLIIPAFNEEAVLAESFAQMDAAMAALPYDYEIIYVDDGSRDGTWPALRALAQRHPQVRAMRLSRNLATSWRSPPAWTWPGATP